MLPTPLSRERATSDPDHGASLEELLKQKKKRTAFPKLFDLCGYLDIRTRSSKSWRRKYFVLANNFLLMASTPYSEKLEKVIPLEGSNVKNTTKTSPLSFEILVRKKRNQFRAPNEPECNVWTEKIQRASRLKIKDIYRFDALLGTNATGSTKVLSGTHRVTGEEVAVKVISKKEYNPKMLSNEVLILKRLDHPHVVKLFDLFETKKNVYLVMEKCLGGELFEQIANIKGGGGFSEKECVTVLHQIAKALKYMHTMGIVHRDLKPENILCVFPNSIKHIKIADFGISKVIFDPEIRRKEQQEQQRQAAQEKKQRKLRTLHQREQELNETLQQQQQLQFQRQQSANDDTSGTTTGDEEKTSPSSVASSGGRRSKQPSTKKKKKFIDPLAKKKHPGHRGGKQHRMSNAFLEYKNKNKDLMDTMCGTISYTAPEILKERPYDRRVDYWSLGVIAFILLCGYPPFWGETELDVAHSIINQEVIMDEEDWSHVSDNGKRLVLGLLERNPNKRLGVDDVLKHTWIYASKSVNKRTRKSFMTTVAKRRIRKMSMGAFETTSKKMDYLYRHHKQEQQQQQQMQALFALQQQHHDEDSQSVATSATSNMSTASTPSALSRANSNSFSYGTYANENMNGRNSVSFSNDLARRFSRTDDDLFELRLPSGMTCTPRSSNLESMDDDDDEDGYNNSKFQFDSVKRKYSE